MRHGRCELEGYGSLGGLATNRGLKVGTNNRRFYSAQKR